MAVPATAMITLVLLAQQHVPQTSKIIPLFPNTVLEYLRLGAHKEKASLDVGSTLTLQLAQSAGDINMV